MTIINGNTPQNSTLYMPLDGDNNNNPAPDFLQGAEGRKYRLYATSSNANPIVKIESNCGIPGVPNDRHRFENSAVIENLIIDGDDQGVTGILLENVCHCQIRNVTIKNCDVGIHIRSLRGYWSECNFLKHIRMENVKKGIVFTTTGRVDNEQPGDSAAFTIIEDVGIQLANRSDAVGIQVGGTQLLGDVNSLIKPYSARIKANVWLDTNGGTGLKVLDGEVKFAQAHLTVMGKANGTGVGVDVSGNKKIWYNQFSRFGTLQGQQTLLVPGFMLVTSGVNMPINPSNLQTDIQTQTF